MNRCVFVPHIVEFIEEDGREILSSSYSQYQFFKQYPVTDTAYACTGFRVTRVFEPINLI